MRCIIHYYYTFKAIKKKKSARFSDPKVNWDSQGKNLEKSGKSQGILKTSFSRHHDFHSEILHPASKKYENDT